MRCPSCSHENRDDAGFCASCGSRLALTCARCSRVLPPSARFCDGCGAPIEPRPPVPERDPRAYTPPHLADRILTLRSALEGERKQVTVLFADVQGSMELADRVDPETWHGILDRFFTILADGVHRFEGTINQYTGDGIMALFGAPLAHEDHARRACYAALHLTEELRHYAGALRREQGVSFSVRMGLNSGEVVVGRIGDDLRMDYTAQGNTVGLAQRMEQLCEPGKAYLTDHTAAPRHGLLRARGPRRVHGEGHSPSRCGSARSRASVRCARDWRSRAPAASPVSSAATRRRPASMPRSSGRSRGTDRSSAWWASPASARAGCASSSPDAASRAGSPCTRRTRSRTVG